MELDEKVVAITQALFALWTAVMATQQAVRLLAPPENSEINEHLRNAYAARDQCLEHLQKLIKLMEQSRG